MAFFIVFLVVLFFLISLLKYKMPSLIGWGGERFVSNKLRELDPRHFLIIDDLLLPSNGTLSSTQLDHVVVSNFGIFCVETKAYSGWIFGNARQQYWTQVIYHHKERFYNPLRQNYAHIKAIEELLENNNLKVPVVSLVAFPDADKLVISGTDQVGHARDVINKIKTYTRTVLSDLDRNRAYELLFKANILDKQARKSHKQGVRLLKRY